MAVPLDDDIFLIKKMGVRKRTYKKWWLDFQGVYIYTYIHVCFHLCVYMYLYIYIYSPVNIAMENPNLSWYHEKL